MKHFLLLFVLLFTLTFVTAQQPKKLNASEIYESIKKVKFLGSVLYLAAHPDDENTRLISYFSNHVKARTAYLSLTRGDGGQNLVGPELREALGLIRTQELLAARKIDGGEQFFTRANDFGYSKHPDETLEIWNKDEVLKDVVSIIRKFKPDVIINRFDHKSAGKTHGHHTSSAMLSLEAFDLINNKNYKSHGLYDTWQAKRLFFNTHWWFYGSKEKFEKVDKSNMVSFDIGIYFPSSGLSNTEIASKSRSQHQSQGFGSIGSRGFQMEYIDFIKGEATNNNDVFNGIDTTWNRVKNGKQIDELLQKILKNYDFNKPSASVNALLNVYQKIQKLEDNHWKEIKAKEIKNIITACLGLYIEVIAKTENTTANSKVEITMEAINRSNINVSILNITNPYTASIFSDKVPLKNNEPFKLTKDINISSEDNFTTPYWLDKKGSLGMYHVENLGLIGNPETPKTTTIRFDLLINKASISLYRNVIYKYRDPVKGEIYQPFEILPLVTSSIEDKVIIFSDANSKKITVKVKSNTSDFIGKVILEIPNNWQVQPKEIAIEINKKGGEKIVEFTVFPPKNQSEGNLSSVVISNGKTYRKEAITIAYNHIPKQSILMPSTAKVVRLNIAKKGQTIAYIQGAGDKVPTSLRQIGYSVIELNEEDITYEKLQNFDAVIMGIRAYNVNKRTKFYQKELHKYVKNGGTLIAQYNTSHRVKVDQISPYHLKLSRDRVVDENAKVTLINTDNEILNYPNKITENDFENWVQERGLYFPNEWSDEFTPLLSMHDKGETAKKGSLLVAKYGKGHFIYTGLSFFRELPAGVPGAYKLFANMISVGKNNVDNKIKN
jgi:LmbE family N-acetylglucosaminyl deacetylase